MCFPGVFPSSCLNKRAKLRALMDDPERAATEPIWMDPPPMMKWAKVSPAEHWSKLDVIANNAVRFEILRRFGEISGGGQAPALNEERAA